MKEKESKIKSYTAREIELKIKVTKGSYWKLYYNNTFPITQPVEHIVKELKELDE